LSGYRFESIASQVQGAEKGWPEAPPGAFSRFAFQFRFVVPQVQKGGRGAR